MSDGTIGNVKAMCRDEGAPTAPLAEFLEAYNDDDNWWWQISCGHHQNLFDAAVDERDDALAEVHRLTEENQRACEEAADTMRYLIPADVGLDEWPDGCEDLPERLAKILAPQS